MHRSFEIIIYFKTLYLMHQLANIQMRVEFISTSPNDFCQACIY